MQRKQFLLCLISFALFGTEGLEYTHVTFPNSSYLSCITGTQSIHLIDINPSLFTIKPVKALDNGIGRESVLSLSTRHGAIAAINSGFFSIGGTFDGKACGTLKINDWYALPVKPRGCIGWSSTNQNPIMDRLLVNVFGTYNQNHFPIDGLNKPRKEGEIVFFTPNFHRTTLTNPDGEELVINKDLIQSVKSQGSTKIPEEGGVLSIQANHKLFHTFTAGSPLTITTQITPLTGATTAEEWETLEYIVGGTPLLLYNSARIVDFSSELTIPTFLSNKHARTAIGILPNKHWILVVVDKTTYFDGMTMDELSNLMVQLGCVHALNLDGGGSSTMVYEGQIINSPHGDEDEGANQNTVRRVSDAILVIPKQNLSNQ
ncbi:MAG TPA: phosphodiester glycosidase family protein [Chlamydiales bacterium]|nr:phosphodiester glycosidase family protein [Chlamydiales bacterium]